MIALGCFIIFILGLIFTFPTDSKNSDLVSDNYYEEELEYQKIIDAKHNAARLKELPKYKATSYGIEISFPEDVKPDANKINFVLFRTEDSNLDVKKEITLNNHKFIIPGKVISKGSYTLKIKWTESKKPYQVDYDIVWK